MQKPLNFLQTMFKILRGNRNVIDFEKHKIYERIPDSS